MSPVYKLSNAGGFTSKQRYTSMLAGNTAYELPGDFQSIATLNGNGSSFELTFSSIPSTFAHLQMRCFLNANNVSAGVNLRINGDTDTNYTRHRLIGNGSTASSVAGTSLTQIPMLGNAGLPELNLTYGVLIIDILDYTNTNKYTTIRYLSGQDSNGSGGVDFGSGLWLNTASVTSLTIKTANSGEPLTSVSQVALYGIKSA